MNVNQMFPKKYVAGDELPPTGIKITIASVKAEQMRKPGAGMVDGWVLWADKAKRAVVLTPTLARQIAQALQEQDTDNWTGRAVVLYPEPMTVAGQQVTAIRAKAANGNQ